MCVLKIEFVITETTVNRVIVHILRLRLFFTSDFKLKRHVMQLVGLVH